MSPSIFAHQNRAWGNRFDSLSLNSPPPSPPVTPPTPAASDAGSDHPPPPVSTPDSAPAAAWADPRTAHPPAASAKKADERMPHDASVFVGCLPTNVDQHELSRALTQHLSDHAQIRNIKVVRDPKGSVCAFVQCDSAASAAHLIEDLRAGPPRLFMGRYLRYEAARAFRTLLISYRVPGARSLASSLAPIKAQLPSAMRIWKPRGAKFISVVFDAEAREFDLEQLSEPDAAAVRPNSPSAIIGEAGSIRGGGILLDPLAYGARDVEKMAAAFGPLEYFGACNPRFFVAPGYGASDNAGAYPSPHDVPRASGMDTGCWEVKWAQRDDCVKAFMTLRHVPFLTLSWAHHPHPHNVGPGAPMPAQRPRFRADQGKSSALQQARYDKNGRAQPTAASMLSSNGVQNTDRRPTISALATHADLSVMPSSLWGDIPQETADGELMVADLDFVKGPRKQSISIVAPGAMLPTPRASFDQLPGEEEDDNTITPSALSAPAHAVGRDRGLDTFGVPADPNSSLPELCTSPMTPKTPQRGFPYTPKSPIDLDLPAAGDESGAKAGEKSLDFSTVFVGGLETIGPHAWDEARIRKVFDRYGPLEDVKFVRTQSQRPGFAFVRFADVESSARAVAEEHNRTYGGRSIRVQIRDNNPQRTPWKYGSSPRGKTGKFGSAFSAQKPAADEYGAVFGAPPFTAGETVTGAITQALGLDVGGNFVNHDSFQAPESGNPAPSLAGTMTVSSSPVDAHYAHSQPAGHSPYPIPPVQSAHSLQYPAPSIAYYTPAGWMAPCPPPYPYHMAYYPGHPGMPTHDHQAFHVSTPGSDANGSNAGGPSYPRTVMNHNGFGSAVPYPASYPIMGQYAALEQGASRQAPTAAAHPPLRPQGFLQGDNGLVPVYQPDALDQYMARGQPTSVPFSSSATLTPGPAPLSGAMTFPPPPPTSFYPYPPAQPNLAMFSLQPQPHSVANGVWMPTALPGSAPGPVLPHVATQPLFSSPVENARPPNPQGPRGDGEPNGHRNPGPAPTPGRAMRGGGQGSRGIRQLGRGPPKEYQGRVAGVYSGSEHGLQTAGTDVGGGCGGSR